MGVPFECIQRCEGYDMHREGGRTVRAGKETDTSECLMKYWREELVHKADAIFSAAKHKKIILVAEDDFKAVAGLVVAQVRSCEVAHSVGIPPMVCAKAGPAPHQAVRLPSHRYDEGRPPRHEDRAKGVGGRFWAGYVLQRHDQ